MVEYWFYEGTPDYEEFKIEEQTSVGKREVEVAKVKQTGKRKQPKIVKAKDCKRYYVLREVPIWEDIGGYVSDWAEGVSEGISDFIEKLRFAGMGLIIGVFLILIVMFVLMIAIRRFS